MRTLLALLIFALAVWRGALDWLATVAQGEAWRFLTVGELWGTHFPKGPGILETLVSGYLGNTVWSYVSFTLIMPVVAVLCLLGGFIWMIRRPGGAEKRSLFKR